MKKKNCWEHKECGRESGGRREAELGVCPAAVYKEFDGIHDGKNAGRACWVVAGTLCTGKPQGTFAQKYKNCSMCDFYRAVREEEKDLMPTISLINKAESEVVIETVRMAIEKKQELYRLFTILAEKPISNELKTIFGHFAHEEFTGLSAVLESYHGLVDRETT